MPQRFTSINGSINGVSSANQVSVSAFNKKGQLLDSVELNGSNDFELSFKTKKALKNARKGRISIVTEDLNGDTANFTLSNGTSTDLNSDRQETSLKIRRNTRSQDLDLDLSSSEVGGTDPKPNTAGNRLALTAFQDVYSDTLGGSVIGADFVDNGTRFSAGQDIVTAAAGTLGQLDDLRDITSGDGDQLLLSTDAANNLQTALAGVTRVAGLETVSITANNDNSAQANLVGTDFGTFTGVNTIEAQGSFDGQVRLVNYLSSGARSFDFSGVNSGGVSMQFADAGINSNDPLNIAGSAAADLIENNLGTGNIQGRNGNDFIIGNTASAMNVAGQGGFDTINLTANNRTDTVSLATITAFDDRDAITNFAGAAADPLSFDRVQFNATTFNNYTAGSTVNQQLAADAANLAAAGGAQNVFIVDTFANITANGNLSQTGNRCLAYAFDTNQVLTASNGDFTTNAVEIATLDAAANFLAAQNVSII